MTCIVGLRTRDGVTIGGDSAGVAGWAVTDRADAKVFRSGPFVFGFTTSFRMGQLLRYATTLPEPPARDHMRFMVTRFIPAVREAFDAGDWHTHNSDEHRKQGGTFLVGYPGRLFAVHDDYQVADNRSGIYALGSGDQLALGSLHTTRGLDIPDGGRVHTALRVAADLNAGVAAPFRVVTA